MNGMDRKKRQVDIGLHYEGEVYDLRVPEMVTLRQLAELLRDSMPVMDVVLPEKFRLQIINKHVRIDQDVVLAEYPVGNGDQFEIIEEEGYCGKNDK